MIKALDYDTGRTIAVKKVEILSAFGNSRTTLNEIEVFQLIKFCIMLTKTRRKWKF